MTCQGWLCTPSGPKAAPWLVSGGQSHVEYATSIPLLKLVQREGISPSNRGGSEGAPRTMIYRHGKAEGQTWCQGVIGFCLIEEKRQEGNCIGSLWCGKLCGMRLITTGVQMRRQRPGEAKTSAKGTGLASDAADPGTARL